MSKIIEINKKIVQPGFHNITDLVVESLNKILVNEKKDSGMLTLFCMHTSCGLVINESFDPTARQDLENFLDYIAPKSLPFICHTLEGVDDSPAHMKTMLTHTSLSLIVDQNKLVLGQWQGIYLAEFRDGAHTRKVKLKFQGDCI